jgi:hypothetical protein
MAREWLGPLPLTGSSSNLYMADGSAAALARPSPTAASIGSRKLNSLREQFIIHPPSLVKHVRSI